MAGLVRSEAELVRRARLLLALQSALAVAMVLALVGGAALWLIVGDQDRAAQGALRRAVEGTDQDDLARPPPGISLFILDQDGWYARCFGSRFGDNPVVARGFVIFMLLLGLSAPSRRDSFAE